MSTDEEWSKWGQKDPYYGVIVDEKYRAKNIDQTTKKEFFASGFAHIESILDTCEKLFGACEKQSALDFGCGVGRLVLPLSERFARVSGIDISTGMLQEAALNAAEHGRDNINLSKFIDDLPEAERFDFVHSYIVLQHIGVERGLKIIEQLMGRLRVGGVAAIHVTYGRAKYRRTYGKRPLIAEIAKFLKLLGRKARRVLDNSKDPEMQMNNYNLNKVLFIMQSAGVHVGGFEFTDHKNQFGVILFAKKSNQKVPRQLNF